MATEINQEQAKTNSVEQSDIVFSKLRTTKNDIRVRRYQSL